MYSCGDVFGLDGGVDGVDEKLPDLWAWPGSNAGSFDRPDGDSSAPSEAKALMSAVSHRTEQ